jgi:hypothetical protein
MTTPSRRRLAGLIAAGAVALAAVAAAAAAPETRFEHVSAAGVAFTVTPDGLARIALADRLIAQGGWYAWNAGPAWFGHAAPAPLAHGGYSKDVYASAAAQVQGKTLTILSPTHVRVHHQLPQADVTFDYQFADEDVIIRARVENHHPDALLTVPAFGGLRFVFAREPDGLLSVWHTSYLRAVGTGVFHPSNLSKIGGSYATDGQIGIGISPILRGLERTLFLWDWDNWNPDTPERRANRWLTYLRADPVAPGGALTFGFRLRVSPNTDWRHLLGPYKETVLAVFGPRQYATDHRCVAVAHLNRNREAIGPDNPYGFHGGFRRLDLADQVDALCDLIIPGLQAANGQGLILWGQGGQEPRGQMYRADFDILPPAVAANWPRLAARFREAGLAVGVTTRPRHLHLRRDWETDLTVDLNPDDPQHLDMLWQRFRNMIDRGVTLFYLDSFGSSLGDVKIMRSLRERMGPDIHTYAEHACDLMALYSAFYSETDFYAAGSRDWATRPQYQVRTGLRFIEIVRWLFGDVPVITRLYDRHGEIPAGFEPPVEFFYRHGLTPMLQDYQVPELAPGVRAIQDRVLRPDGQPSDRSAP